MAPGSGGCDTGHMSTDQGFERSAGLGDWRMLNGGAAAWFEAGSHSAGAELVREALASGSPTPSSRGCGGTDPGGMTS